MTEKSIKTVLQEFDNGTLVIRSLWYDWFCRNTSLINKGTALLIKLKAISKSKKINVNTMYVFFKNNCPVDGTLYDDFRICDIETGDVIYTVVPKSGAKRCNGLGEIWGKENDFKEPLFVGKWKEIKKWFLE